MGATAGGAAAAASSGGSLEAGDDRIARCTGRIVCRFCQEANCMTEKTEEGCGDDDKEKGETKSRFRITKERRLAAVRNAPVRLIGICFFRAVC